MFDSGRSFWQAIFIRASALVLLSVTFTLAGCCPKPMAAPGPATTLKKYARSLESKDTSKARDLLSTDVRKNCELPMLLRYLEQGGPELKRAVQSAANAESYEVTLKATVRASNGSQVDLVQEDGSWHLDAGSVVPYVGFCPESALEYFLRAVEAGDCRAMLASAPPDISKLYSNKTLLQGCQEQLKAIKEAVAAIRNVGSELVIISETRAELTYKPGRKLVLVKKTNRWYIEDL